MIARAAVTMASKIKTMVGAAMAATMAPSVSPDAAGVVE